MPVYLTFDIDCLDPSFAPEISTPVCGGLSSDRALKILRGLTDLDIVGMDVVEVAPSYDQSDITALVSATIALEMLYASRCEKGLNVRHPQVFAVPFKRRIQSNENSNTETKVARSRISERR